MIVGRSATKGKWLGFVLFWHRRLISDLPIVQLDFKKRERLQRDGQTDLPDYSGSYENPFLCLTDSHTRIFIICHHIWDRKQDQRKNCFWLSHSPTPLSLTWNMKPPWCRCSLFFPIFPPSSTLTEAYILFGLVPSQGAGCQTGSDLCLLGLILSDTLTISIQDIHWAAIVVLYLAASFFHIGLSLLSSVQPACQNIRRILIIKKKKMQCDLNWSQCLDLCTFSQSSLMLTQLTNQYYI